MHLLVILEVYSKHSIVSTLATHIISVKEVNLEGVTVEESSTAEGVTVEESSTEEPLPETYFRLLRDENASEEAKKNARKEVFDAISIQPELFVFLNEKIAIPMELYPHNFVFNLREAPEDGDISRNVADRSGSFIRYYLENELTKERLQEIVNEGNSLSAMSSLWMNDVMSNEEYTEESKQFATKFKEMGEYAVRNAGLLAAKLSEQTGIEIDDLIEEKVFIPNGLMELLTFKFGFGLVNDNFYEVQSINKGHVGETNEHWILINATDDKNYGMNISLEDVMNNLKMTESLMRYFECSEPARFYLNYTENVYVAFYSNETSRIEEFIDHYSGRINFDEDDFDEDDFDEDD